MYELARELGVDSAVLMNELARKGVAARSASGRLDDATATMIRSQLHELVARDPLAEPSADSPSSAGRAKSQPPAPAHRMPPSSRPLATIGEISGCSHIEAEKASVSEVAFERRYDLDTAMRRAYELRPTGLRSALHTERPGPPPYA